MNGIPTSPERLSIVPPIQDARPRTVAEPRSNPASATKKRIDEIREMKLLTEREVSEILGKPAGTLRRWRCTGEGPVYIKLGSGPKACVRYDPLDIVKYVEEGRRFPIRAGNTGGRQWL